MRDVLGTIAADQDAIIRAGSRGALVVDGGPGTGKTVVALHRSAYLLYSDPRLGHRRGGVLFVGPHQPYLAYVADVLPSLGEEGVQICTLRDLVAEGAAAAIEADPDVARLKSSADLVQAIETAVRFYENPPAEGMTVETHWSDIWLSAADWAEAFEAAEPGTPHNEAREAIWAELLTILMDSRDGDVPADLLRKSLLQNRELRTALNRAWPLIEPADLVADLWSVPAYLRMCAPWLSPHEVQQLQREDAQAWTVSDLPLLDAARQRLGDPEASRRKRRHDAAVAAEREQMARVLDNLIEAADDEYGAGLVTMLRGEDFQDALVNEAALPGTDPDLLAGPFAHIVVDEAQELTDAQWQMLLLRCPSRSFTIVGDRAQARHGFTESWQERLERIGLDRISLASLSINYRTPQEVMAEAEPVIRAVLPDANVPTSIRSTGIPVIHGPASDLGSILDTWLAAHADGIACRHRRSHVPGDIPRPVADPGAGQGARVRPGRPHRPGGVRHGHRRSGRPLRRDDPGDPATRHPHEPLTFLDPEGFGTRSGTKAFAIIKFRCRGWVGDREGAGERMRAPASALARWPGSGPASFPGASSNGSGWPGHSPAVRRSTCSTSPPRTWTRACARRSWTRWRAAAPPTAPTAIYATHDAAEALAIAGRVAVLHSGAMAQAGLPAVVYAEPGDLTVARLTGPVSVLDAPVLVAAPGTGTIGVGDARVTVPAAAAPGRRGRARDHGPPRAASGPVRWSLLRARLMPREHPAGPKAAEPGDLRP